MVLCCFKKKVRCYIDDFIVKNDHLNLKEEELVKKSLDIFKNLNPSIFRRSWINTGLVDEKEFNQEVEEFEEFDVASCLLQKEEKEELIDHFLELQIDQNKAAALVHDQEIVEIQDPEVLNEEKPSSAKDPKKQLKITCFFK
jgi:hypothetical protein